MDEPIKEVPLVVSEDWGAGEMSLSPDGRWLAYSSNRLGDSPNSDAWQIWVQPFPDINAGRWQRRLSGTVAAVDGPTVWCGGPKGRP